MKKVIIIILVILTVLITGCEKKKVEFNINCNGDKSTINLKEGNTFKCTLSTYEYTFKIKNISNNKVIITTKDTGLAKLRDNGTFSLIDKYKTFKIEKNKENTILTQSTDYQEKLIINWK